MGFSQRIEHLFLDLFQFVLHLDDDVLHLSLVRLRACGVDLTPHLLGDETELLALTMTIGHGLAKVFQMVCQALLLLADVEFLDIIDELLL